MMKAAAAFLVFAGIGLILRYVLMELPEDHAARPAPDRRANPSGSRNGLDLIVPGTSVADILGSVESDEEVIR